MGHRQGGYLARESMYSARLPGTDPTWDTVREAIWPGSRALYIVAAGNEGTSLDEQSSSIAAPLRWASLPNVIGVGATNNCEDVLGDIVEQDGIVAGSNHGAAYVHLRSEEHT